MDQLHYLEMEENLHRLLQENRIQNKQIYLFGHCNATEALVGLLRSKGFAIMAILDNNTAKHEKYCDGIPIKPPGVVLNSQPEQTMVCIAARAYAAMAEQLKQIGYKGQVSKLVDYNSYAEYSLSPETISKKQQRVERGIALLQQIERKYFGCFKVLCPFAALGDVYFTMAYLPYFLRKRKIHLQECMVGVIGEACGQVVSLFGSYPVEVLAQSDMDELIQAALYTESESTFISHQDRPYVLSLSRALYIKQIPLEMIYCCGVFGLPAHTKPCSPVFMQPYDKLEEIVPGKSVILSPYAKSVTALKTEIWVRIIRDCQARGYICYTNVVGEERPLPGTVSISPSILQMQSAVERAGTFIGIRSGLCDVIREASCRKIALYPDYCYCDTKWKAIDMYWLEGWENIVAGEDA